MDSTNGSHACRVPAAVAMPPYEPAPLFLLIAGVPFGFMHTARMGIFFSFGSWSQNFISLLVPCFGSGAVLQSEPIRKCYYHHSSLVSLVRAL